MTIDDKIRDEKLQHGINREAAKISALSSGKTDKYEYLTGKKIQPSIVKSKKSINRTSQIYIFSLKKSFKKANTETS